MFKKKHIHGKHVNPKNRGRCVGWVGGQGTTKKQKPKTACPLWEIKFKLLNFMRPHEGGY